MMGPRREITRDLSHKLQEGLAALLDRDLKVAAVVLEPGEIGVLLLEAAVMMTRTCAATIAGMCPGEAIEQMYDMTVASIVEQVKLSRADGLCRTRAAVAPREASAS